MSAAAASSPPLPAGYSLHSGYPSVAEYLHLRAAAGLSPKTTAQAAGAVAGSWYGCYVQFTPEALPPSSDTPDPSDTLPTPPSIVGMGRVIGDGGWYFHIADMAVLPGHQRRGLGDAVLKQLLAHIRTHAAEGAGPLVNLFADPPGRKLYGRNGFVASDALDETGMVWRPASPAA